MEINRYVHNILIMLDKYIYIYTYICLKQMINLYLDILCIYRIKLSNAIIYHNIL